MEKITMYYYHNKYGQKIWTCNAELAFARAAFHKSEAYSVEIQVQ